MYYLILYLISTIIGVVGVWLGYRFAVRNIDCFMPKQSKNKQKNKEKILNFLKDGESVEIRNSDVEKLLSVSSSTAERYLNELEKERIILQNGKTGRNVFYTLR